MATTEVQIYNTLSDTWRSGISLPNPTGGGAAAFSEGKIHFLGGLEQDRQADTGNHYVIDSANLSIG